MKKEQVRKRWWWVIVALFVIPVFLETYKYWRKKKKVESPVFLPVATTAATVTVSASPVIPVNGEFDRGFNTDFAIG